MARSHPLFALLTAAAILACSSAAHAATTTWAAAASAQLKALQAATHGFTTVKLDPTTGAIRLITGGNYTAAGKTAEDRARAFLATQGAIFAVPPDLSGLMLVSNVHSGTGSHLTFQQTYQGIPVYRAHITVHVSDAGQIFRVTSSFVPALNPKMTPVDTKDQAVAAVNAVLKRTARPNDRVRANWAIYAAGAVQTRAWVVNITPGDRFGFWEFVVDATTGAILRRVNRVHSLGPPTGLNGTGTVYAWNPIKTLDDNPLTAFSSPTAPRKYINFPNMNGADYFTGSDSRVYTTGGLVGIQPDIAGGTVATPSVNGLNGASVNITPSQIATFSNFTAVNFHRNDPRFLEANTYFWIDTFKRFVEDPTRVGVQLQVQLPDRSATTTNVGINANVHDKATVVPANDPMGQCTPDPTQGNVTTCKQNIAFYDFNNPSLHFYPGGKTFGDGTVISQGVPLAEDTDVILHEYAHAIMDGMIPGGCCDSGASLDTQAMAEGFGDYTAAWFAQALGRAGRDPASFGSWANAPWAPGSLPAPTDAITATAAFGNPNGGPKRRLDGSANYVIDANFTDPFERGQIWAGALFDLKNAVGFRVANRAIYEALYLEAEGDDMPTAANAILLAHDIMDFGIDRGIMTAAFVERGILPAAGGAIPQLTAATTSNTKLILLTFDQPLQQLSVTLNRTWNSTVTGSPCFNQVGNYSVVTTLTGGVTVTHPVTAVGQVSPNVVGVTLGTALTTDERPTVHVLEIADVFGNRAFCVNSDNLTGGTKDGIPPSIVGATIVGGNIQIQFSEAMNATTITNTAFTLSGGHTVSSVSTVSTTTFALTPSPALRANERVILRLARAVSDANGVVLGAGVPGAITTP